MAILTRTSLYSGCLARTPSAMSFHMVDDRREAGFFKVIARDFLPVPPSIVDPRGLQ